MGGVVRLPPLAAWGGGSQMLRESCPLNPPEGGSVLLAGGVCVAAAPSHCSLRLLVDHAILSLPLLYFFFFFVTYTRIGFLVQT